VDELMRLAEPLAERGRGTFAITHGPDFGPAELAELSIKTGRPVTWTALNATPGAFRLLERAEARGGEVWPQVACRPIVFQVTLAEPAPFARADAFAEVLSVPAAERARFYRDPAWRERARHDVARQWHYTWEKVFVQETTAHPELADGPSLAELAKQRGTDPLDIMCDVALDDDLATRFRVAPGYAADLVAFDPATVRVEPMERAWDLPAGADRLIARSHGLHHVWVNGEPVTDDSASPRPGRLIRDGGTSGQN
jgi:N-acyl-D-amino-acid deacylase